MAVKTKELLQVSNDLNKKISDKWVTIPVKNFAEIINGGAFKSKFFNKTKGIRLVRIRDLMGNRLPTFYDGDYDKRYIVNSGDFLVGMDGDFIGAEWRNGEALLNQRVCKIITNDEIIHLKFFRLGINRYLQKIHSATSYLTVAHLSSDTINNIEFPFPSLSEQKRIVSKIESIFAQIDATKMNLENIQLMLKRCRWSVLKHAFEGMLVPQNLDDKSTESLLGMIHRDFKNEKISKDSNLPKGWYSIKLEDQINIAARIGWRGLKKSEYTKNGALLLAVKDIKKNGRIYYDGVSNHLSDFRYEESPEIKIQKNDILITKDGTIGKIGFVDTVPQKTTVNSSILIVRPSKLIFPQYLFYYFRAPNFQKIVRDKIQGTAVPHLFQHDIKKFQIDVAPLSEQKRIVSKIESIFDRIDAMENYTKSTLSQLDALKKSTLKQAFEGNLVPQDPNDEPAEILLEKIKQEKKQLIQKQKSSRGIKNVK